MKASFLDFRKRPGDILRALERHEEVVVCHRGHPKAVMQPVKAQDAGQQCPRAQDHPAFGMWKDREDFIDVSAHLRKLRQGRFHGV